MSGRERAYPQDWKVGGTYENSDGSDRFTVAGKSLSGSLVDVDTDDGGHFSIGAMSQDPYWRAS